MDRELQECKTHGLTAYTRRSDGRFRCRKCSSAAVQKRRDKLKLMSIEYMGGGCTFCGYSKCVAALEFHHTDPEAKDFAISTEGNTRGWETVKAELDKCIMLCANCHREEHERIRLTRIS